MSKLTNRGASISTGGTGIHTRAEDDFYATPSETTKALLDKLELKGSILEPSCVDEKTEYFNGFEWKKISEYKDGDKVLQYNKGEAQLVLPLKYLKKEADIFYEFENHILSMSLSPEHIVYYYDYRNNLKRKTMEEVYNNHKSTKLGFKGKIPTAFKYNGNLHLDEWLLRLSIAISADGRIRSKTNLCEFRVTKERKKERIEVILKNTGIKYKYKKINEVNYYYFYSPYGVKIFPKEWYNLSLDDKKIIVDEVFYWDGHITKENCKSYYTSEKRNFDFIQFMLHSCGYSTNTSIYKRSDNLKTEYRIILLNKKSCSMHNSKNKKDIRIINKTSLKNKYKYCFKVYSGMLILRRDNKIFITGNCGMGHISKALQEYYPNQEIVSTDLVDRGFGQGNIDFLTYDYNRKFDNIITNPPFSLAKEFVTKGLEITNDKVIMLLKIQFLESKGRKEFLENSPLKYIYVFSERQSTLKDGLDLNPLTGKKWSTTLLLAWFVWEKGYEGEPIVRWL